MKEDVICDDISSSSNEEDEEGNIAVNEEFNHYESSSHH
jgi:hypothetical protein